MPTNKKCCRCKLVMDADKFKMKRCGNRLKTCIECCNKLKANNQNKKLKSFEIRLSNQQSDEFIQKQILERREDLQNICFITPPPPKKPNRILEFVLSKKQPIKKSIKNPTKKSKFKCDCDKKNCILESEFIYNQYFKKLEKTHLNESAADCPCCSNNSSKPNRLITTSRHKTITQGSFNNKTNLYDSYKCSIAKSHLDLNFVCKTFEKTNLNFFKAVKEFEEIRDKQEILILKLREISGKSLKECVANKSVIKKLEIENQDKTAENKKLRTQIKKLKNLMTDMIMIPKCEYEDDEEDNEDEDDNDDNDNDLVEDKGDDDIKNTLQLYENIKNHMIVNKVSISDIARNNGISKKDLINQFLKLKMKRIKFAHPLPNINLDDKSFIELLNNV